VIFLEANLGSAPSKIYWSILDGREVLQLGLMRRIGTSSAMSVWNMAWLPIDSMQRLVSSARPHPPQLVSELIDSTSAAWDQIKLQELFTLVDIDVILNIPLCHQSQPDFRAWHYDKTGVFIVRSADRMLIMRRALSDNATRSNKFG
jgi:hypothetical protein